MACLNQNEDKSGKDCVQSIDFLSVFETKNLQSVKADGIVGLNQSTSEGNKSFLAMLQQGGLINR